MVQVKINSDHFSKTQIVSDQQKTFLIVINSMISAGLATTLFLLILNKGSMKNLGFLLLLFSSIANMISNVLQQFVIWTGYICRKVIYQFVFISWRTKDFCLHTYILIRTDALTNRKFHLLINIIVSFWFIFNLFRLASLFSCWGLSGISFFDKSQPRLELTAAFIMLLIDCICAILITTHYVRYNQYSVKMKNEVSRVVFLNSNIIFLLVIFLSIPAYVIFILVTLAYYDGSFVNIFSFEENLTTILLSCEFLKLSLLNHYKCLNLNSSKIDPFDSKQSNSI